MFVMVSFIFILEWIYHFSFLLQLWFSLIGEPNHDYSLIYHFRLHSATGSIVRFKKKRFSTSAFSIRIMFSGAGKHNRTPIQGLHTHLPPPSWLSGILFRPWPLWLSGGFAGLARSGPGTETFTGKVTQDLTVGQDLQEGQDTGKGCRVPVGGKFGLDRKGLFNHHNASPLGCF